MNTAPRQAGVPQALVIIAIALLPMMAIVTLMPIIPALIGHFRDVPNIQVLAPLVVAAPGLCVALFSPYAGFLTDRLGRRRLLLIFAVVYGIGGMVPFFVESFPVLMAGRLLLGIGEAFILTVGNTLLGDYFDKDQRAKWLMWQGITGSVCGSLLLSVSGHLSAYGWNVPFLVYGFALLIAIAAYFVVFEPPRSGAAPASATGRAPDASDLPRSTIARIAGFTFVLSAIYFVYTLHFSMALDGMGIKDGGQIGNISAIASIAVPFGAILYKLMSRKGTSFQFTVLYILLGVGMTGIGLGLSLQATVAFAFVQQLGAGMVIPVLIGFGLRDLPDRYRGRGMGIWASAFFLGQFVSPFFVTVMRGWTGSLLNAFVAFGLICIAVALGSQVFARRQAQVAPGKLAH
jgi:MFS family permease